MFLPVQLAAAKALSLPASWYKDVNEFIPQAKQLVGRTARRTGMPFLKNAGWTFCLGEGSGFYIQTGMQ